MPDSPLDGIRGPFGSRRGPSSPLALFALWFLKSGAWDNAGQWVDRASWVQGWFLATGTINVFGVWADSEAWT